MDCGCWRDHSGRVETIVVTENHPYLRGDGTVDFLRAVTLEPKGALDDVRQSRWTAAGFLSVGDALQSADGGTLIVVSSELVLQPTEVYNFEVSGDHSYAVGELLAWVHNKRFPPVGKGGRVDPPGRTIDAILMDRRRPVEIGRSGICHVAALFAWSDIHTIPGCRIYLGRKMIVIRAITTISSVERRRWAHGIPAPASRRFSDE